MASQRVTGKKKPPDREPVLRETWLRVIEVLGREGLVIGGKSMGGRIASLIADEAGVAGLICLGYPFHPTGKSDRLRVEHRGRSGRVHGTAELGRCPWRDRDVPGSHQFVS